MRNIKLMQVIYIKIQSTQIVRQCFFVFICDLDSSISEDKARDIVFEVMIESKIFDRLDLSAELWEQFNS